MSNNLGTDTALCIASGVQLTVGGSRVILMLLMALSSMVLQWLSLKG